MRSVRYIVWIDDYSDFLMYHVYRTLSYVGKLSDELASFKKSTNKDNKVALI